MGARWFTDEEWKRIPLRLRQKFWQQTDYGRQPPSDELMAEMRAALEQT
jgi:hypothetical protein